MITALKRYYLKYMDDLWCRRRFGLKDLKNAHKFRYGRKRWSAEGGKLNNGPDEKIRRAREPDQSFLKDKVVAGFGRGPRRSLAWATSACERIKTLGLPGEFGQSACATGHLCERPRLSAANLIEAVEALVKA